MSKLKSVSDLAAILGCQKITIYRRVKAKKIPHKRIGRLIRFSDDQIRSYLDSISMEAKNEKSHTTG